MAVQTILSSDKLQSGFRSKYNTSVNEIIVSAADQGGGIVRFTKHSGAYFDVNLGTSYYTKAAIDTLIAGFGSPASESAPGIIEIATDAEALAGSSDVLAITPFSLAYVLANSGITGTVSNTTSVELTVTELNTTYSTAGIGFEVLCENLQLIYKKGSTTWWSIPMGGVSA